MSDEFGVEKATNTEKDSSKSLAKDRWNIALLLLLYTLQGIPIGLAGSIPMVLQAKKVGYRQQAMFSFVSWPFSVKLLWAPIVDAIYSRSFGRRKSWLIPVQYLIGGIMIVMSYYINTLLGDNGKVPNVFLLTILFFLLFVCAATQDIAVDGWAITMLSRENVGHASTCNSVGQTMGYFMGYTIFLALESKEFCNSYIRSEPLDSGMIDLPSFLFFWGIVFITVTSLVMLFKKENREIHEETKQDITSTYMQLLKILKLRPVQMYALFLLTSRIGLAASESITGLKLVEAGLPREKIALIALPMVPVQILLPLLIRFVTCCIIIIWVCLSFAYFSRMITGPRPMDIFVMGYPFRHALGIVFAAIVWWTTSISVDNDDGAFPSYYYFILVSVFIIHQVRK